MSSIVLKDKLFNEILVNPAKDFDTLCIISGFATPSMVAHQLEAVEKEHQIENLNIKLIVGMTPFGISKPHHENFVKLTKDKGGLFECSYINSDSFPVHTKLYTWLKNGEPKLSFLASANYTLTGFRRAQDEIACVCNPIEAYDYYNSKIDNTLYCTCDDASSLIIEPKLGQMYSQPTEHQNETKSQNLDSVYLPLFSVKYNAIQEKAGLNWGQRKGRDKNQAYIAIPSDIGKSNFFPPRGNQFSVLTDDGFPFICVVAQGNNKAIETPNNNSELGEYFRRKLGVPLGAPVTLEDLDRYGNRYVKFTKIDEEEYYMEYVPKI